MKYRRVWSPSWGTTLKAFVFNCKKKKKELTLFPYFLNMKNLVSHGQKKIFYICEFCVRPIMCRTWYLWNWFMASFYCSSGCSSNVPTLQYSVTDCKKIKIKKKKIRECNLSANRLSDLLFNVWCKGYLAVMSSMWLSQRWCRPLNIRSVFTPPPQKKMLENMLKFCVFHMQITTVWIQQSYCWSCLDSGGVCRATV